MAATRLFSLVAFLLGVAGLALAAIALGTNRWREDIATNEYDGLFEFCGATGCRTGTSRLESAFIRATRGFMIMGCFLTLIDLILCLVIAAKNGHGRLHIVAGTLYLVAGLFLLIACSVYTAVVRPELIASNQIQTFGYSMWLAWASAIVILLTAPFGYLAKKSLMPHDYF